MSGKNTNNLRLTYLANLPVDVKISKLVKHDNCDELFISYDPPQFRICQFCGSHYCVIKDSGCTQTVRRLAQQLPEHPVVMAMYGCGDSVGPHLTAEIGDVRRFADKRALVAYAGVDPQPSQSGQQNPKSNKISRNGRSWHPQGTLLSHDHLAPQISRRRTCLPVPRQEAQ